MAPHDPAAPWAGRNLVGPDGACPTAWDRDATAIPWLLHERCGRDRACLEEVLADPQADWFAREVAAVLLARRSPGDAETAERIAVACSVRNPDARVTMAWLSAHVMQGARCPQCAGRLLERLEQERATQIPKEYQLAVLTARYSIAKL